MCSQVSEVAGSSLSGCEGPVANMPALWCSAAAFRLANHAAIHELGMLSGLSVDQAVLRAQATAFPERHDLNEGTKLSGCQHCIESPHENIETCNEGDVSKGHCLCERATCGLDSLTVAIH